MATKIQSREVRDAFLNQVPDAMNRLFNFACGFNVNEDGSRGEFTGEVMPDILLQLTNKAIPMMSLEDDQQEMTAKDIKIAKASTMAELMEMKDKGWISDRQLKDYTHLLKTNYEMTELSQLINKLEELEQL